MLLLTGLCWDPARAIGETITGSGFVVSPDGDLVTNAHVVSSCRTVAVKQGDRSYIATVLASDRNVDLALVRTAPQAKPTEIAVLRQSPPLRAGEQAISYGFPLTGALATEGNLTVGYVSALRGLGDDPHSIQITTPIQPGNSGGPLLDSSGNVIGVVAAKLDALRVMRATGDVPQNINFAIDLATLKRFLAAHSVRVTPAPSTGDLRPADIGERAKLFTYLIKCETETESIADLTTPPPLPAPNSADAPVPSALPRLIPVNIGKLKWSDIRQPYPSIHPEIFELNISNAGSDRVTELTIAFRRTQGQPCSRNLEDYEGFKKFSVNLLPGDSVTVTGEFSARAASFCIVRAVGPAVGLAACTNSAVAADVAIAACTSVIRSGDVQGSGLVAAYLNRGNRYADRGDDARATADYTEAIRLNSKLDYAFYRRGLIYAKSKEHDRAISDANEALRLSPKNVGALEVRAYSNALKGNFDRAIADYQEAIKLKPGEVEVRGLASALSRRGREYDGKGEYDRAIADYSEAIRLSPTPALLTRRGYDYHRKGEYDRAIGDYDGAIRVNPNYYFAYNNRGFAYFAKGQYDRAIADYTEAIRLDQQRAIGYRNRGIAHLYSGSRANALADLDAAARLMPKDAHIAVWREIASRQAGGRSTLEQDVSQIDMAAWPAPIIRFLLGENTQELLLASAKDSDSKKTRARLCEANFFVGQLALQRGSKEEAKRAFQIAVRDCPPEFLEMGAAVAELSAGLQR